MSLFDNYTNLDPTYSPNNQYKELTEISVFNNDVFQKKYNALGELVGYGWHYGDKFSFSLSMNDCISIESNAIVYTNANESPSENTYADFGDKAYNIIDLKCWECQSLGQTVYRWEEKNKFEHPRTSDRHITLMNNSHLANKTVIMHIYNFRGENIYTQSYICDQNACVLVNVDEDISKTLISGTYRFEFVTEEEDFVKTISVIIA